MLSDSLDCPFVIAPLVFSDVYLSCVLCTLCCQILWIVHLWLPLWYSLTFICPVYFVPYVVSFSGLYIFDCPFDILWRLFVLCLVYPLLPVSLDCPFLNAPLVFTDVYLSCVLCTLCCHFLWIVYFYCPFGILWRLFVLCLVYPMLPVSLDCIFLIAPLVFSNVYLSCVLCTLCCQFLWIMYFWLPLWYSLTFILSSVSCTLCCQFLWMVYLWLPFWYSLTFIVLCLVYPTLPVSMDCPFVIAPLVFSDVYLSCVLCTLCCQFLWIVYFWLPLWYSLTFICLVSYVPYVVRFSGFSICDCPFGILERLFVLCLVCPILSVSLDCPFLITPLVFSNVYFSFVLCILCC